MSALDAKTRPTPGLSEKTPHMRHIYHSCTRDKNPRTAFCGHKSGPMFGVPYVPDLPDVCVVCLELHNLPCVLCAKW